MKKHYIPSFICVFLIFVTVTTFSFAYKPYRSDKDVDAQISWYQSNYVVSTLELLSRLIQWNDFTGKNVGISSPVAYTKIVIRNDSSSNRNYFIVNNDINTKGKAYESVRFEMIPLQEMDLRLNKTVCRVEIPAKSERTFIIEFKSDSVIYINPVILDEVNFYAIHSADLFFMGLLFCVACIFAIYLIIEFFILRNETYYVVSVVSFVVIFFYAIKIKLLVFLFGPVMKSICYASFFINSIGRLIFLIIILATTLFFAFNYKKINLNWRFCYFCFIPWFVISIFDILSYILKVQLINEYATIFTFVLCQISFSVLNIFTDKILAQEKQDELISYFTYNHKISFKKLIATKSISTKFLVIIREQLQQPLEVIYAISSMMEKTQDYTKVVAYSKAIEEYILQMKSILGLELHSAEQNAVDVREPSVTNLDMQKEFDSQEFEEYKNSAICIYGSHSKIDLSLKMILASEGFFCIENDSHDEILSDINAGKIQMLVIDPAASGNESFLLCRLIREESNMLQLPIIMIINYYANHLVREGYSAGVNDFVIRPFDSAELISRCYLLLQQRKIFVRNKELTRMENEKSTFLYFVTHNVNTPLTLLINRMEELSENLKALHIDSEIIDDMNESVNEINDIIQNVLISFRISDGRFINTQENLFIEDVLDNIRPQIESKAKVRGVKIDWNISELLPQVLCNKQALRGIMVNLLDNAVKYASEKGYVQVYAGRTNGHIKFSVSDDGMGVDSDKISSLFTRFEAVAKDYNKNRPSVGLGLYVANELAKMNGIKIEYSDADIGGACFSLIFPA